MHCTGGLFWFGWTGYSGRIHWVAPVFSGVFTGFGLFSIFLSLLNYIVDSYLMFAASALAGNNFMRCLFGGVFPLFAQYMFEGMGIQWGSTVRSPACPLCSSYCMIDVKVATRLRGVCGYSYAIRLLPIWEEDQEQE